MWVIVLCDGDGVQRTTEVRGPWDTEEEAQSLLVELATSFSTRWVSGRVLEVKEV